MTDVCTHYPRLPCPRSSFYSMFWIWITGTFESRKCRNFLIKKEGVVMSTHIPFCPLLLGSFTSSKIEEWGGHNLDPTHTFWFQFVVSGDSILTSLFPTAFHCVSTTVQTLFVQERRVRLRSLIVLERNIKAKRHSSRYNKEKSFFVMVETLFFRCNFFLSSIILHTLLPPRLPCVLLGSRRFISKSPLNSG